MIFLIQLTFRFSIFYSVHLKWLIGYIVHELVMADIDQINVLFFKVITSKTTLLVRIKSYNLISYIYKLILGNVTLHTLH